jgi:hypothetical protein
MYMYVYMYMYIYICIYVYVYTLGQCPESKKVVFFSLLSDDGEN